MEHRGQAKMCIGIEPPEYNIHQKFDETSIVLKADVLSIHVINRTHYIIVNIILIFITTIVIPREQLPLALCDSVSSDAV